MNNPLRDCLRFRNRLAAMVENNLWPTRGAPMDKDLNVPRVLTINLIYPAVLGSIFYSILDLVRWRIVSSLPATASTASTAGYLEGSWEEIALKSILVLLVLSYFFCDYAYSSVASFRGVYMILDIVVLACLWLAYVAVRTDQAGTAPNEHLLTLAFVLTPIAYFIWDAFERDWAEHEGYYARMMYWELSSAVGVLAAWGMAQLWPWFAMYHSVFLILWLAIMSGWFWWLLFAKRRIVGHSPGYAA